MTYSKYDIYKVTKTFSSLKYYINMVVEDKNSINNLTYAQKVKLSKLLESQGYIGLSEEEINTEAVIQTKNLDFYGTLMQIENVKPYNYLIFSFNSDTKLPSKLLAKYIILRVSDNNIKPIIIDDFLKNIDKSLKIYDYILDNEKEFLNPEDVGDVDFNIKEILTKITEAVEKSNFQ